MMSNASERFFFSPWQWIEWGILVIAGCVLNLFFLTNPNHLLFLWISIFFLGGALEMIIWMRSIQHRGMEPFNPFLLKIWSIAGLFLMIGVIYTLVFFQLAKPEYIPGLWLIVTGLAMYTFTIMGARIVIFIFGTVYVFGGILASSIFINHSIYLLMISFGFGSVLCGIFMFLTQKKTEKQPTGGSNV